MENRSIVSNVDVKLASLSDVKLSQQQRVVQRDAMLKAEERKRKLAELKSDMERQRKATATPAMPGAAPAPGAAPGATTGTANASVGSLASPSVESLAERLQALKLVQSQQQQHQHQPKSSSASLRSLLESTLHLSSEPTSPRSLVVPDDGAFGMSPSEHLASVVSVSEADLDEHSGGFIFESEEDAENDRVASQLAAPLSFAECNLSDIHASQLMDMCSLPSDAFQSPHAPRRMGTPNHHRHQQRPLPATPNRTFLGTPGRVIRVEAGRPLHNASTTPKRLTLPKRIGTLGTSTALMDGESGNETGSGATSTSPASEETPTSAATKEEAPSSTEESSSSSSSSSASTSTSDASPTAAAKDGHYWRKVMNDNKSKLEEHSREWEKYISEHPELSDDATGNIRATIGQAQLLINKRFSQYDELCQQCLDKSGELETKASDLEGFWDVIYIQVENIFSRFGELQQLKERNWESNVDAKKPVSKKAPASASSSSSSASAAKKAPAATAKPSADAAREAAKQRLAAAKAAMKGKTPDSGPSGNELGPGSAKSPFGARTLTLRTTQSPFRSRGHSSAKKSKKTATAFDSEPADESDDDVVITGSVSMLTPVRASKREHADDGQEYVLAPVRRSTRATPSKFKTNVLVLPSASTAIFVPRSDM